MKLSITFPLKTKSENVLRALPFAVANAPRGKQKGIAISIARGVEKQRAAVRMMLDSQLPKLKRNLLDERGRKSNFYRVTITRIGAGLLDWDGVHGALKNVRDEVAAWLGIGDGPRDPAHWHVQQAQCPAKFYLVRIEIEDADPDQREMVKLVGQQPPWTTDAVSEGAPMFKPPTRAKAKRRRSSVFDGPPRTMREPDALIGPPMAKPTPNGRPSTRVHVAEIVAQTRAAMAQEGPPVCSVSACGPRGCAHQQLLPFRKAFYVDPADQPVDGKNRVLTPMGICSDPPPRVLRLHREIDGRRYVSATLVRGLETIPELGGEVWIYDIDTTPDGYAVAARAGSRRRATP